jgi:hypothetical protein
MIETPLLQVGCIRNRVTASWRRFPIGFRGGSEDEQQWQKQQSGSIS